MTRSRHDLQVLSPNGRPRGDGATRKPDPQPTRYYFTTARFLSSSATQGVLAPAPHSLLHAKEMGTLLTVCGQSATTWTKLWEVPFLAARGTRCPVCIEALFPMSYGKLTP